jgi:hypothetical protein
MPFKNNTKLMSTVAQNAKRKRRRSRETLLSENRSAETRFRQIVSRDSLRRLSLIARWRLKSLRGCRRLSGKQKQPLGKTIKGRREKVINRSRQWRSSLCRLYQLKSLLFPLG